MELFQTPPWMSEALCAKVSDSYLWTSSEPKDALKAIEGCFGCPVRRECFLFAWDNETYETTYHVYGGTSLSLRRRLHTKYSDPEKAFASVKEPAKAGRPKGPHRPTEPCDTCGHVRWQKDTNRHGNTFWSCGHCRENRRKKKEAA
jgi:hypothetical protein